MPVGIPAAWLELTAYLTVLSLAGLAVLGLLVARGGAAVALRRPALFWLFTASILAVRLLPVPVPRRHREDRDLAAASLAQGAAAGPYGLWGGGPGRATADLPAWALAAAAFLTVDALCEAGLGL